MSLDSVFGSITDVMPPEFDQPHQIIIPLRFRIGNGISTACKHL